MSIAERPGRRPAPGDEPPPPGDGPAAPGTSGGLYGTTGAERRRFWLAFAILSLLGAGFIVVNVLTELDDHARLGRPVPAWEPAVWETTSVLTTQLLVLALFPLVVRLLRRARGWPGIAAVHAAGALTYSVLHVSGMTLLRNLAYRVVGESYPLSNADFPYELRKDLLSYTLAAGLFWLFLRPGRRPAPEAAPAKPAATFDIRDGARILRVPVAEIRAASSAGNYVEFDLADGRRPLMRATLAAVETALAPLGLLRTHRSWLVNPSAVRAIAPDGSGDFTLELDGGRTAPLSRRFPEALQRLRR